MNMRLAIIFSAILLVCLSLPAQTPAPAPTPQPVPQLTSAEKLAVKALQTEFTNFQKLQADATKDLQDFERDVELAHPGYQFDPNTATLIAKPAPAPEKKEVKPTEKK